MLNAQASNMPRTRDPEPLLNKAAQPTPPATKPNKPTLKTTLSKPTPAPPPGPGAVPGQQPQQQPTYARAAATAPPQKQQEFTLVRKKEERRTQAAEAPVRSKRPVSCHASPPRHAPSHRRPNDLALPAPGRRSCAPVPARPRILLREVPRHTEEQSRPIDVVEDERNGQGAGGLKPGSR